MKANKKYADCGVKIFKKSEKVKKWNALNFLVLGNKKWNKNDEKAFAVF